MYLCEAREISLSNGLRYRRWNAEKLSNASMRLWLLKASRVIQIAHTCLDNADQRKVSKGGKAEINVDSTNTYWSWENLGISAKGDVDAEEVIST